MPHEIARMLERAGFRDVELFGSVKADPFTIDGTRCIALGEKP